MCDDGIRRNEDEEELGGGLLSPPKQEPPRAPLSRAECEDKAALMNLGARSHSGNSPEADAEGWIAFANGRQPQSGENRPETAKEIDLHRTGHFLLYDPFLGGNDPFPEPCRSMHSPPPANPPEGKREMRGQGSGPTASLRAGGERRVREAREIIGRARRMFELGRIM